MPDHPFADSAAKQRDFFIRTTAAFVDADGSFAPKPGMFTVTNHIAHAALTVDWFIAGAFRPEGFDMDFAAADRRARAIATLAEARARFAACYAAAIAVIGGATRAEMMQPMAAGPIMGGAPRVAILEGMSDHTAHHRGALAVYLRLLGRVPAMPYG